jgi:probable rRNA maturation factor
MSAKQPQRSVTINNAHPRLKIKVPEVRTLYRFLDKAMLPDAVPAGELSIAFVDNDEIVRIHTEFLSDPAPTDVITFPGDESEDFAGEICVSADYAAEQAPKFGTSYDEELTLYLIHGWLHLAGYDDIDEGDRKQMRLAEKRAMDAVKNARLLPHYQFA